MDQEALTWQIGVWDQISQLYTREIDRRFSSVVEAVINRASLRFGEKVLDLGTGTGAVACRAAVAVGAGGSVTGVDISQEMLTQARRIAAKLDLQNLAFVEGRAEAIPAVPATFDVVLASLSLMYVIDRAAAAREISRVLRPGGRFVAAVWGDAVSSDIVLFQQTAGRFAPPPVSGVGPGALADATAFIGQLASVGIDADVQSEIHGFDFDDFESAWHVLAGVTTTQLAPERLQEAKAAVCELMWPHGDGSKHFRNTTQFIVGGKNAARRLDDVEERPVMTIREVAESDRTDWVRLREALWPGSLSDHDRETRTYFEERPNAPIIFVAEAGGELVGFLELDYRKYAPGCTASPVPFIEGWYVEPALRGRGIGRALVEAAEAHARAAGYNEIASDAEHENSDGIAAHLALEYEEVERVVCFRRSLRDA